VATLWKLLLLGKAMGVVVVLLLIITVSGLFFGRVYAADAEVKAANIVNRLTRYGP